MARTCERVGTTDERRARGKIEPSAARGVRKRDDRGCSSAGLLFEYLPLRAGRERHHAERIGVARQDVDGLPSDRSARTEKGDTRTRGARVPGHVRVLSPCRAAHSPHQRGHEDRRDRRREDERVHAVQDATVAGDQRPRVLRAGGALEHRLGQIAGLGYDPDRPDQEPSPRTGG